MQSWSQTLGRALHTPPSKQPSHHLLIAGAAGYLGSAVTQLLAAYSARYTQTTVLCTKPIQSGIRHLQCVVVPPQPVLHTPQAWPPQQFDTAVMMFEPPRSYYTREHALYTPTPDTVLPLAQWLRHCGVRTLALVLPHQEGALPEALRRGLASMQEQELAALGFERLLIIRSSQARQPLRPSHVFERIAALMLGALRYMQPAAEGQVRASKVAEFVAAALLHAPAGTHIAAAQDVWLAAQGNKEFVDASVKKWLQSRS